MTIPSIRPENLKTWIEINRSNVQHNVVVFRKLIGSRVKLWAVVKSNAYGHGLFTFSRLMNTSSIDGLCVDSVIEGVHVRQMGIKKDILVLGPTLPRLLKKAASDHLTITVSTREVLENLGTLKYPPFFHIKLDTGMRRQGFYVDDFRHVLNTIRLRGLEKNFRGLFTHFASADDVHRQTSVKKQLAIFEKAVHIARNLGFKNIITHCANTGGTLLGKNYHGDAVRVGIGLYGLWPSRSLERQTTSVVLKPVLSWKTIITEIKLVKKGDRAGYGLTESFSKNGRLAVLPVGYWYGYPRALSSVGEVLIRGQRAKVIGRVSMDLMVVDVSNIRCAYGDLVTLIGRDRKEEISAHELADRSGTIHYEIVTRLNPLTERIIV